VHLTN